MAVRVIEDPADPEVLGFLGRMYPGTRKSRADYQRWRCRRNDGACHLVERRDGRIVGSLTLIRDSIQLGHLGPRDVMWICDLVVDREARGTMVAPALVLRTRKLAARIMVTGAGPHMLGFYKGLKFLRVRATRVFYLPLAPSGLLALRREHRLPHLVATPVDLAAGAVARARVLAGLLKARPRVSPVEQLPHSELDIPAASDLRIGPRRTPDEIRTWLANAPGVRRGYVARRESRTVGFLTTKAFRRGRTWWTDVVHCVGARDALDSMLDRLVCDALRERRHFVRLRRPRDEPKSAWLLRGWMDGTRPGVDDVLVWTKDPLEARLIELGPHRFGSDVSDRVEYGADEERVPNARMMST